MIDQIESFANGYQYIYKYSGESFGPISAVSNLPLCRISVRKNHPPGSREW